MRVPNYQKGHANNWHGNFVQQKEELLRPHGSGDRRARQLKERELLLRASHAP